MSNYTIGILCPSPSWGGLEMNVERMSRWLHARGHRIVFFGDPDSILFKRLADTQGVAVHPVRSSSKTSDLILAPHLAQLIKREGIQFLISNLNRNFLLIALTKRMLPRDCRLIYLQHMHVGSTKRDWWHTFMYRQLDAWVTPLEIFSDPLLRKTRLTSGQITVIPFGVDLTRLSSALPSKEEARKQLQLPSNSLIAGVVGRLDPKKCQHVLVEACASVRKAGHDLHVLIVGDESMHEKTDYTEQLRSLVSRLGLETVVHFHPHFDRVELAYAAMDIFALTSQSETYGMVTIEAMASGLPVIGTNEGGTPGILTDQVNGLLVPPLDAESLATALIQLASDDVLRRRLGSTARRDACEKYSYQRQCELWEALLARLSESR